jgi:hypothetical protein
MYVRTGLGAVNPDVPLSPCSTRWAWSIPTCWQWPKSLIYGDNYPNPPAPPVVGSTLPDGSPIPVIPESGAAAQETIQAITDQQIRDTQAGNQVFFEEVDSKVNAPAGVPWWVWLAGGGLVFAMVAMGGGSPRRYGR